MGAAEARLFAREGAKVAIADIREEDGRKIEAEIAEFGSEAIFVSLDVSQEDQWNGSSAPSFLTISAAASFAFVPFFR